jgi:hypothetical protein
MSKKQVPFEKQTVTVELTYKDMNYIESALRQSIRLYGDDQLGNVPDLKRYCERVLSKVRKRHQAGMRENLGEIKWKRMRKAVNKFMREARKKNIE